MANMKRMPYDGDGTIYEVEAGKKYKLVLSMGTVVVDPDTGKEKRPRRAEMFDGTFAQAKNRMRAMCGERDLLHELVDDYGLDLGELAQYGLTEKAIFSRRMSAREVDSEFERLKKEVAAKAEADRKRATYAEVSDAMLAEIEKHGRNRKSGEPLTNKTLMDYRTTERHVVTGHLGKLAVVAITEDDVLQAIQELRDAGRGEVTVNKAFAQIRRVLEYARKRKRLIAFNPVDGIDDTLRPVKPKSERKGISHSEWTRMVRLLLDGGPDGHSCAALLAATNGLRMGECFGLVWSNIVLDAPIPYLHVKQQHTALDGLHKTKAKEGHKTPLDAAVVDFLRKWAVVQAAQLNELGIERGASTPVCSNAVGGFLDSSNYGTWWRSWAVKHGFGRWYDEDGKEIVELVVGLDDATLHSDCIILWRDLEGWPCDEDGVRYSRTYKRPRVSKHYKGVTPHMLRHTLFTLKAADTENPVSLKELQYLGGWTTPRMVTEIYTHHDEERALKSGGMVDRMLSSAVQEKQTA